MKVLIIQKKMIGDVLTSTILFEAIKQEYPDATLHYVINANTFPVVEHNPFIDRVLKITPEIEKNSFKYLQFLNALKNEKYDVVIDVYGKLGSALMAWYTRAKVRIGHSKSYLKWAYTNFIVLSNTRYKNYPVAFKNRLEFLTPILSHVDYSIEPKIYIQEAEKNTVLGSINNYDIPKNSIYIMVSIFGSSKAKTYPLPYMAKVLDSIVLKKPNVTLFLNYLPKQEPEVAQLVSYCTKKTQKAISNYYESTLRGFIVLTSFCTAVVGNEGGAINMGRAVNCKSFSIYSPWINQASWSYTNCKKHESVHLKNYKPEMFKQLSNAEVKERVEEFYAAFTPNLFEKKLISFFK